MQLKSASELAEAKRMYFYGFTGGKFLGQLRVKWRELDDSIYPESLLRILPETDGLGPIQSQETRCWQLVSARRKYRIKGQGMEQTNRVNVYDITQGEVCNKPSIREIAGWLGVNEKVLTRQATADNWAEDRANIEKNALAMVQVQRQQDITEMMLNEFKKQEDKTRRMEDLWEENYKAGKVTVTNKDLMAVFANTRKNLQVAREVIGNSPTETHVQSLQNEGLIVEVDYEVVEPAKELPSGGEDDDS
jgi:hypothetical protein